MLIAIFIAILIPLAFMYIIWALEMYSVNRGRVMAMAFAWGMISFVLAYFIQTTLVQVGLVNAQRVPLTTAPVIEETLKALGLFVLAWRLYIRYAVDGAAYGFAIGTGFAVVENLIYLVNFPDQPIELALSRVLSVSLMQAFNTAFVGAVIGRTYFRKPRTVSLNIIAALIVVMLMHFVFNLAVLSLNGTQMVVVAIVIGLGGTLAIVLVINQALADESRWISSLLASENVPDGERVAAVNPDRVHEILTSHRDEIGARRAELLDRYMQLTAQRAMLIKTMQLNQRPSYAAGLRQELADIDAQLALLRGSMGLFTRTWLRSLLPSSESATWRELESDVGRRDPLVNLVSTLNDRQSSLTPSQLETRRAAIRATRLFKDLDADDCEDLAVLMLEQGARVGEPILTQDDVSGRLFLVASGSLVGSTQAADGSESGLRAYTAGDLFGELSMIDQRPSLENVEALSDTVLYTLTREDLITLVYARPVVGIRWMKHLAGRLRTERDVLLWVQQTSGISTESVD